MKLLQLFLTILIGSLISCSAVQTSGTSSDIDIELIGVAAVENQPIANARVVLSTEIDSAKVAETITDDNGVYRFDSVRLGTYYLTADMVTPANDTLVGTLSEIYLDSTSDTTVRLDTLWMQRPGAIRGKVNLNGGTGEVFIYIPGTSYDAHSDDQGNFVMSGIYPDSNYTVKFVCDGFTSTQVFDITVLSGDTLELSTQNLHANNAPQNVTFTHDTLTNTVTLNWDPLKRDDVKGYLVARQDNPNSVMPAKILDTTLIVGTAFTDKLEETLFSQSSERTFIYYVQGVTDTYEYTGRSNPITVNAVKVLDTTKLPGFTSFSIKEGEVLTGLASKEIKWNYRGGIEWVRLDITTDGGETWQPVSGLIKNNGVYNWEKVLNVQSDQCRFRIKDVFNESHVRLSEFFTINMVFGEELIKNGGFSTDTSGWRENIHDYDSLVDAAFSVENGVLKTTVSSTNEKEPWKIRLLQKPGTLSKLCTYELRIKARATTATTIDISFFDEQTPSSGARYYGMVQIPVGTVWEEHVETISLSEWALADEQPEDPNAEKVWVEVDDPISPQAYIAINFGNEPGEYYIDDVSLRIIDVN